MKLFTLYQRWNCTDYFEFSQIRAHLEGDPLYIWPRIYNQILLNGGQPSINKNVLNLIPFLIQYVFTCFDCEYVCVYMCGSFMFVSLCVWIFNCWHVCIYKSCNDYILLCVYICKFIFLGLYVCILCPYCCMLVCLNVCIYVCLNVLIFICLNMCMFSYLFN